jgi:hypothetical protein
MADDGGGTVRLVRLGHAGGEGDSAGGRPRALLAAAIAAAAIAAGVGGAGCGDDNEGAAEEAGKAIDRGAKEVEKAVEDVDVDVDTDENKAKQGKKGGKK